MRRTGLRTTVIVRKTDLGKFIRLKIFDIGESETVETGSIVNCQMTFNGFIALESFWI